MTLSAEHEHARRGITAAAIATSVLTNAVDNLDNAAMRGPSLLPGWTRAHVITHLARHADALLNLLIWARTGVEHPMYASSADQDADIEEGAARSYQLLAEDLFAACGRFAQAADAMPKTAWSTGVAASRGTPILAARVPWLRVREVWVYLIDLDAGVGFDAVAHDVVEHLLDDVVQEIGDLPDAPALTVEAMLPDGRQRSWRLGDGGPTIGGTGVAALAWLTGRGNGAGLSGSLPALPRWV